MATSPPTRRRIEGAGRYKTMTLPIGEFIRRFLIHVLPKGVHRIRHYGLFANGNRAAANIARARELLAMPPRVTEFVDPKAAEPEEPRVLPRPCPCCGGRMIIIEIFAPGCEPKHRPTSRPPPGQLFSRLPTCRRALAWTRARSHRFPAIHPMPLPQSKTRPDRRPLTVTVSLITPMSYHFGRAFHDCRRRASTSGDSMRGGPRDPWPARRGRPTLSRTTLPARRPQVQLEPADVLGRGGVGRALQECREPLGGEDVTFLGERIKLARAHVSITDWSATVAPPGFISYI
jgi:hypothetical protein